METAEIEISAVCLHTKDCVPHLILCFYKDKRFMLDACNFGIPASDRRATLPDGLRNECSFPEIYPKSLDSNEELIMAKVEIIWSMLTNCADKKTVAEVMDIPEENLLEISYTAKGFGDGVRAGYIDIMGELMNVLLTHTDLTKKMAAQKFVKVIATPFL